MTPLVDSGTVLRDRYRIVSCVGEGGGGAVYRADDLRLAGRVTAVKEIRPDPTASAELQAETQEQFRREASTLARLDHPALPKVSDYFVDGEADFLVMDFVDGPDLRQVVDERRAAGGFLAEEEVLRWAVQLLEALDYLHHQEPPVVHRDVKPANIKLVDGGRVKLVDFGLVKPLDPSDPRTLTVARGIGSLPYTPLEQYAGDTGFTDARSDLYAVGATLYHLLTGHPPPTAQERFLMPNALRRPRDLNHDVSERTQQAVLAAMALHPDHRPADARALRDMLLGLRSPSRPTEDGPGRPIRAPLSGPQWRAGLVENAGMIAIVAMLLLLALLATWQSERARAVPDDQSSLSTPLAGATATSFAAPTAVIAR
ncbi:MAG: serine/threonine-protein kinase [Anaerolineae bacterium]